MCFHFPENKYDGFARGCAGNCAGSFIAAVSIARGFGAVRMSAVEYTAHLAPLVVGGPVVAFVVALGIGARVERQLRHHI